MTSHKRFLARYYWLTIKEWARRFTRFEYHRRPDGRVEVGIGIFWIVLLLLMIIYTLNN
jgi:hypothetical protein